MLRDGFRLLGLVVTYRPQIFVAVDVHCLTVKELCRLKREVFDSLRTILMAFALCFFRYVAA
ncbi:hypothetical protein HMPREF1249_1014 [Jonquetella sp. BV3C21]|nr:hypothetical protein GCWU000246_01136 [Jonquetella anthropi E3_33 E1]ERL23579.1 hypothetical protein HMPREF1249_1014 [Jonquetella sp. BV3C21]